MKSRKWYDEVIVIENSRSCHIADFESPTICYD